MRAKAGIAILGLAIAVLTLGIRGYKPSNPVSLNRPVVNVPLSYFWGIAHLESDFDPLAVGRDGADLGMWQLRSFYNRERGVENPFDPVESTRYALKLFQKNMAYLKSIDKAISSHKRGRAWTIKYGIDKAYVRQVKGYNVYAIHQ